MESKMTSQEIGDDLSCNVEDEVPVGGGEVQTYLQKKNQEAH